VPSSADVIHNVVVTGVYTDEDVVISEV
jgi:hypothetical protein